PSLGTSQTSNGPSLGTLASSLTADTDATASCFDSPGAGPPALVTTTALRGGRKYMGAEKRTARSAGRVGGAQRSRMASRMVDSGELGQTLRVPRLSAAKRS